MSLMSERAHDGSTILCVTHNVTSLDKADQAVVLRSDAGATTAYTGPANDAPTTLGCDGWPETFTRLSGRPARHVTVQQKPTLPPKPPRLRSPLRTWLLLISREAAQVVARRASNVTTALLPVLGALLAVVAGHAGWVSGSASSQVVSLLATVAVLTATSLTYAEVVHELPTIRREYRIGVSGLQVVAAKLTVATVLLVPLTAALVAVYAAFRPLGGQGSLGHPGPILGLATPLFLAAVCSSAAGLLVSAASPNLQRAVGLSTALAIVQVALNGTLVPLDAAGRWATSIVPARLAVGAQEAYLGNGVGAPRTHDPLWRHHLLTWVADNFALVLVTLLLAMLAGAVLDRRCRKPD